MPCCAVVLCCAVLCLQAPFCVHPKTGKVCVPIDPAAAWDFDLDQVPTVQQLVTDMQQQQQQDGTSSGNNGQVIVLRCR